MLCPLTLHETLFTVVLAVKSPHVASTPTRFSHKNPGTRLELSSQEVGLHNRGNKCRTVGAETSLMKVHAYFQVYHIGNPALTVLSMYVFLLGCYL